MKILLVIDSIGVGGAEHSTAAMMPLLRARGHDVRAATLYDAGFGDEERLRASGLEVRPLTSRHFLGRVRELRSRIRAEQPDIVHTALFASDMVGRVAACGTKTKIVSSLVNTTYDAARGADPNVHRWKLNAVQLVDALTGRMLVDRFHAVSEGVAEVNARDLHLPRTRIGVVQRGRSRDRLGVWSPDRRASARKALGVSPDTKVVLTIGRQEHQKAHVDLVAAIAALGRTVPDLKVFVAGREGNASAQLHAALLRHPEAAKVIELLGHRHDVADLLCAADVLAIPSLYEGTAGAALEAMSLRCPVVCTDLAGVRGVLVDDHNALLVPVGDAAAMAAALAKVLAHPPTADRLRESGLGDFDQRFTIEVAAAAMECFYVEVLAGGSRPKDADVVDR